MPTSGSKRQASHTPAKIGSGRDGLGRFTKGRGGSLVIDGDDLVVSQFRFLAAAARPAAAAIVVAYADKAAQRMRNRVPIGPDSWHVLNSITSDETAHPTPRGVYADAGPDPAADPGAFVARFLEYGTIKQSPSPFIEPAVDETLPEFIDAMRRLV